MDKFDQQIIKQLQQDARQSVAQIASAVNLSRSAVAERIKRLELSGVIQGYQAVVRQSAEPQINAYFALSHQTGRCIDIVPILESCPEIKSCHGISGEVDLMLWVEVSSMERLHQIREWLDSQPTVLKITTHMVMSEWFKR